MADYNPLGRTGFSSEELYGRRFNPSSNPAHSAVDWQEFEANVREVMQELGDLLISKHRDYGPKNVSLSPGGPINGLRVRMHDKMARINNLVDNQQEARHEPLEDSFKDLANYGIIGLLVLRGKWDK
jgi:hypothetical protein